MLKRRDFIKASSFATLGSLAVPKGVSSANELYRIDNEEVDIKANALISAGLNKAADLGSSFTDIRLMYSRELEVGKKAIGILPEENLSLGVRILYNGYWGFASTPVWSESQVLSLVDLAFQQAKGNSEGPRREVDVDSFQASSQSGAWVMPVKYDPFERNPYEYMDWLNAITNFIDALGGQGVERYMLFKRRSKWYGSSTGIRQKQISHISAGEVMFQWHKGSNTTVVIDSLSPAGVGYELFSEQDVYQTIVDEIEGAKEDVALSYIPVDVGRYPVVLNALGVAAAVGASLGTAFELDRILGVEANAGGTSFISDPVSELGSFNLGSPLIQIDGNRSEPGGAATVKWDDEGSPVDNRSIVINGILQSAFTDRELVSYLGNSERGIKGCAVAQDATYPTLIHPGNMTLKGSESSTRGWSDMISSVDRGLVFKRAGIGMDYQLTNGTITGDLYEVRDGKRTARVAGGGLWFKTAELWNNLEELGAVIKSRRLGMTSTKGEPIRTTEFSVTAPPALFNDMTIIDITRK